MRRRKPGIGKGVPAELVDPRLWPQCRRWDGGTQPCSCWCSDRRREWTNAGGEARAFADSGELWDRYPCNKPIDWSQI
jgi:hypothetical protein